MQQRLLTAMRRGASLTSARSFATTAPRPLAKIQLIGRLADSPELVATSTGRELIRYALAVPTGARDELGQRATSWFNITSFVEGPVKERLLSLAKGTKIYVDADAEMKTYETKEGEKRTSLRLTHRHFETVSTPGARPEEGEQKSA